MAWSDRLARLALGTACLTPLPLFAGCPTGPEDFTRGVYIVYDDASTAVIVRTADGLFVETTEFNDGSDGGAVYVSHMGYMQMELSDTTGGEILPASTITMFSPASAVMIARAAPPVPMIRAIRKRWGCASKGRSGSRKPPASVL